MRISLWVKSLVLVDHVRHQHRRRASGGGANHVGTVTGTVKDAQGGIIPGATVTLVSETRGTTFDTRDGEYRRLRVPERRG